MFSTVEPPAPCFAQPVPRFRAFVERRLRRGGACRIVQSPGTAHNNDNDSDTS
jgi:hypothetical protein